ncbi:serine protease inhibitor A3N-like [Alexandromys fortis]|uniref:serine protease inhibitor A3N-like n=1 Tax=Alexandromys fortis TaxID=100897 RepID=UPI0021536D80|nr:serine protease inhibitor A3N-like [Microtus fortis]
MMVLLVALGFLMAGICPDVSCQQDGTPGSNTELQEGQINGTQVDSLALASTNTDFAFSLYKELALKNPDENIVFSPLSISAALAVLSLGASNNTLQEILEGLKFNLTETPEADIHRGFGHLFLTLSQPGNQVQISTGNAMFIEKHQQILAEFKEKARALYQVEASSVDFQQAHEAKKLINDYVRNQTQEKIKELISDLDKDTVMVLVNYFYFKGQWEMPFPLGDTLKSMFHLNNTKSVEVPVMNIEELITPYFRDEELSCTLVELKYRGNASALFILPDEGRMQQVEANLKPETLRKWRDSLSSSIIELSLPKFSISTDYKLEGILPQLGIREVFSTHADLSGITGTKDLSVSQVVHKAVLDVAETGTEAAAATEVVIKKKMFPIMNPLKVNFNRPFLMIISDRNTQSSLFLAKVTNPKEN